MRTDRSVFLFVILFSIGASPLRAQSTNESVPIARGELRSGQISVDETHRYTIDLQASSFVTGAANQIDVDLVVTVYAPDGEVVRSFDDPARGPESFQFDAARSR